MSFLDNVNIHFGRNILGGNLKKKTAAGVSDQKFHCNQIKVLRFSEVPLNFKVKEHRPLTPQ